MEEKKKIASFTDLISWKESHKFVLIIYRATKNFPREERFSLTDQIRRAAISITNNIAEGFSRKTYEAPLAHARGFFSASLHSKRLSSRILKALINETNRPWFSAFADKDKVYFYYLAAGSASEVQNQLIIAKDLGYISITEYNTLNNQQIIVSKLLQGLIKSFI